MTDTINVNVQKSNTTSPRSRVRTPWLMLGAAVFLLTAIVVWWGISSASDRTQALVVIAPVAAGEPITAEAVGTTGASIDGGFGRIYVDTQRDVVVGAIAVIDLEPGDLLGPSVLSGEPEVLIGERLVGVVLRAGRYPNEIQAGDTGLAVKTQNETGTAGAAPPSSPVRVVAVTISETKEASVTLAVTDDASATVGSWAGEDQMVLVISPLGADE
jgi:hypothetical protein